MKFDMSINDNFAHFHDESSGDSVFVESFDNVIFEVYLSHSTAELAEPLLLGEIQASSSDQLNQQLEKLRADYLSQKGL